MRFSCCPNFQTVNFADFKQFKIVSYFADIGEVKIDLNCLYTNFEQVSVIIMTFGREKQSKLSPFDKQIQEPGIESSTSHFQ